MLGWRGGGWRESREDLGRRAPEVANDRASKNQAPYLEILLIARIALIWDWLFGLRQCWLLGSWVTPFRHDSCLDRINRPTLAVPLSDWKTGGLAGFPETGSPLPNL